LSSSDDPKDRLIHSSQANVLSGPEGLDSGLEFDSMFIYGQFD